MGRIGGGRGRLRTRIRDLLGGPDSLRRRTLFSGNWLLLKSVGVGLLDFAKTAIFARVLYEYDYGLMALAVMVIGLLESLTSTGIDIQIQRDGQNWRQNLPAYWTIKAIRGIVLFALAWGMAPLLAAFYDEPQLIGLVRVLGVTFLLNGLAGFGREVRQRRMEFKAVAIADVVAAAAVLALGLLLLFWLRNVWVLALYTVLVAAAQFTVSYLLFPWWPRLGFDRDLARKVLIFAGAIIALQLLNYLFGNLDRAVIGKVFDVGQLGFYARAHFLALLPTVYFANVIAPIFLPVFRQIADDPVRLRAAFLKTLSTYLFFFLLLGLVLLAAARPFILVVYGADWMPVLPYFRILLLLGVSKGVVSLVPTIFFLKEKPWLATLGAAIMTVTMTGLLFPLIGRYGIIGAAWAVALSGVLAHLISIGIALRLVRIPRPTPHRRNR
jgi:O-antigen/teichoic acid export membrane protein